MLNLAVRNTGKLIREKSKSENIRLGRLFTKKDTARLMADMAALDKSRSAYTILDVGAGTGILSAAMIERICKECRSTEQIFLTCYENDPDFADMLEDIWGEAPHIHRNDCIRLKRNPVFTVLRGLDHVFMILFCEVRCEEIVCMNIELNSLYIACSAEVKADPFAGITCCGDPHSADIFVNCITGNMNITAVGHLGVDQSITVQGIVRLCGFFG